MTEHSKTPSRNAVLVLAVAAALLAPSAGAWGQDRAGLDSFFESLFGRSRPVQLTPSVVSYDRFETYDRLEAAPRRRWRRRHDRVAAHRLPSPRRTGPEVRAVERVRPPKVNSSPSRPIEPMAALLSDVTLRKGDIVVMSDGPKVFTGDADASHRLADFEDARRSQLLDGRTRALMAATIVAVDARPVQGASTGSAERQSGNPNKEEFVLASITAEANNLK